MKSHETQYNTAMTLKRTGGQTNNINITLENYKINIKRKSSVSQNIKNRKT